MKSGISVLLAIYPDRRATQQAYSSFPRVSRRSHFVTKKFAIDRWNYRHIARNGDLR